MPKELERRSTATQIRMAACGDGGPKVGGYAASFNTLSAPLPGPRGMFRERIAPGAFSASLKRGDDVFCLMNHDVNKVMGRTRNRTLSLREDSYGLNFDCDLPDTSDADDLRALVLRGDIDSCSFGFTIDDNGDDWDEENDPDTGDRCQIRTLRSVRLFDVSCVTAPAYPQGTSVSARSLVHYTARYSDPELDRIRRHHDFLGRIIAADAARVKADRELCERMENAAGIVDGRRKW